MYFRMMKVKRLKNMRTNYSGKNRSNKKIITGQWADLLFERILVIVIREDTQKKVFSLVVEPIRSGFSP